MRLSPLQNSQITIGRTIPVRGGGKGPETWWRRHLQLPLCLVVRFVVATGWKSVVDFSMAGKEKPVKSRLIFFKNTQRKKNLSN